MMHVMHMNLMLVMLVTLDAVRDLDEVVVDSGAMKRIMEGCRRYRLCM